jgi:hypothetical protein
MHGHHDTTEAPARLGVTRRWLEVGGTTPADL